MASLTKEDTKWMAESDARTLADADTIRNDSTRLKKAKDAAKRLAKEETVKTETLRKIAGLPPLSKAQK